MNFKNNITIIFLMLFLAACKVTKDYQHPDTRTPEQFRANASVSRDTTILEIRSFFNNKELLSLIDTALLHNNNMQLALQNIAGASAVFKKSKLNYLPELNAQINANRSTASKNSLNGITAEQFTSSRTFSDYTASLGLTWEIDIWGKIKREKEEARSNYLQTQAAKKAIQTRLVADVANGYYNLLMLDAQLEIAFRNKSLSENTLKVLEVQYKVGDANTLGLQQAKAQMEQTKQLIAQIEQDIVLQENALSILCGTYAGSIDRKALKGEELNAQNMDYDVAVLAARPDVFAAELNLRAANARVGVAKASMYPTISLSASAGLNSLMASNWFSIPASLFQNIAGGITQPVFNRKRLKLQHELAKIDREKAVIDFRQTVLVAYGEVSDAIIRDVKLREQLTSAENREQALEEGITSAKALFANGMVNYLEIITAENNYLQAGLSKVQLYREQMAVKIELYRAVGGGWK